MPPADEMEVGVDRASIDRAQLLLATLWGHGEPGGIETALATAIDDGTVANLAYVLAGMVTLLAQDAAGVPTAEQAAALRARMLLLYARVG